MKKLSLKSAISSAVLAAGLVGVSMQATAAVGNVGGNGTGDVLLYQYYTTQNKFQTLVHLVNTSSKETVIAKVRFRDYKESKDAMDFTVILSPNDVFSGYLTERAGQISFVKTDNTCTSPQGVNNEIDFPASGANIYASADANKHSGHIEVITEAVINNATAKTRLTTATGAVTAAAVTPGTADDAVAAANLAAAQVTYSFVTSALHGSDGVPANCGVVDNYFSASKISKLQNAPGVDAPAQNSMGPLAGHFVILDASGGVAAGGRPVALRNAVSGTVVNPAGGTGNNLVTGQFEAHWPVPNLMNVSTIVPGTTAAVTAANVAAMRSFESMLNSEFVNANEWSAVAGNKVTSEMIITQPLKYAHRDKEPVTITLNNNQIFGAGYTNASGTSGTKATDAKDWDNVDERLGKMYDDADGCINYSYAIYDREEQTTAAAGTSASGGPATQSGKFCNETTALNFGGGVTKADGVGIEADTSGLNQQTGLVTVFLGSGASGASPASIGYSMWKRSFSSPSNNYSHIMPNM